MNGERLLTAFIDGQIAEVEKRLAKLDQDGAAICDPRAELLLLVKCEEWLLVKEQLSGRSYLTIPVGRSAPQTAKGTQTYLFSPHELASGGLGQPFFAISESRHSHLKDMYKTLSDMAERSRRELIRDFNSRAYLDRREWVDRYRGMQAKVAGASHAALSAHEFADFAIMSKQLQEARAEVVDRSAIWAPSQRKK